MITFPEFEDINGALEETCRKINEEVADYAARRGIPLDHAHWMVAGLQSAKKTMLLTFATRNLMSVDVFRRLFDESVDQIKERCKTAT